MNTDCTFVPLSLQGRIQLNSNVNVTSTGIEASNGYYHHVEGILLPPSALPILPHKCDIVEARIVQVCTIDHTVKHQA